MEKDKGGQNMLVLIFVVLLFSALQLLCCLKWKRKLAKAIPLLVVLLFICVFFALMAWSFSLPSPTDMAAFRQQDEQFKTFYIFFCIGVWAALGELLGWLIYGILLLSRGRGDKYGTGNSPLSQTSDIERCSEVVKEELQKNNIAFDNNQLIELTKEIMRISWSKGSDYSSKMIRAYTQAYLFKNRKFGTGDDSMSHEENDN